MFDQPLACTRCRRVENAGECLIKQHLLLQDNCWGHAKLARLEDWSLGKMSSKVIASYTQ